LAFVKDLKHGACLTVSGRRLAFVQLVQNSARVKNLWRRV